MNIFFIAFELLKIIKNGTGVGRCATTPAPSINID